MAVQAPEPDSTGSSRCEEALSKNPKSEIRNPKGHGFSQRFCVLLIVILGLALRLTGLWWGQGYFYFGQGDGVAAYSVAVNYAQGEAKAQYLGQPNYNEHSKLPGPLWTLFCVAGLRLYGSITGVILLTILLNTIAIWLTYRLTEATLGHPASFWAALFAATTPSAVFYSVGVYNPEVMPFLGSCFCLALWKVVRKERSRHIFWVPLLLLMMPQFHMSGLALWPTTALVLALAAVRLNGPWLAAGFLAGLLLYVPYILGDSATGWQNTLGMLKGGNGFTWDALKTLTTPFNLLINWVPQWTRGAGEYRELGRACFGFFSLFLACNVLSVLVAIALFIAAILYVHRAIRSAGALADKSESVHDAGGLQTGPSFRPFRWWYRDTEVFRRCPGPLFLALMTICPLLFALISGKPFHARYALVLFPPLLALAGCGAAAWSSLFTSKASPADAEPPEDVTTKRAPRLHGFLPATIVISTCVNIYFLPAFYWHQGTVIAQGNLFVPSFRNLEQVYQHIKGDVHNMPIEVDDGSYLQSFKRDDPRRDASLIRRYVAVREMESGARSAGTEVRVFKLVRADQAQKDSKLTVYLGHEIALIATRTD
ncbi:MAG: hypothetical protein C5B50_00200 [Verrucomicrobia bacterium]|nr:MAG: hypothetical protein C5B50_00200 [Verrucomicrobiota bacterium]